MSSILILSDTHGLIRPEIAELAPRFDHLLHAGDIGDRATYEELRAINPELHAVAGNVDRELIAAGFPTQLDWWHEGYRFRILHDLAFSTGETAGVDFVIFGHSHKPEDYTRGETRFINPGPVGPRRFRLPISYATMEIDVRAGYTLEFQEIASQPKEGA